MTFDAHAFPMTIGGQQVTSADPFDVIDPATGEVFAQAPSCSTDQLDDAFAAAADAGDSWGRDRLERAEALGKSAQALLAGSDELVDLLVHEQGQPLGIAAMQIHIAAMWFQHFAYLELPSEVLQDDDAARIEVLRRPLGVVAAITPWNFPIALAAWKLAPALAVGNTVVLKPSPYTPVATLLMGRLLAETLPPGVLNVISGPDPLGAAMTSHPVPRKITFTGSVATGKAVARSAADDLKRVTLELGGNDPAVLLDDVDVGAIAEQLFFSAFVNSGQTCVAVKRVYAPESIYDKVVDALVDRARAAVLGPGIDPRTTLGPVNNAPQWQRVRELVTEATRAGAEAITGGQTIDDRGYYIAPTILRGAREGMRIVDEEQFGPALPIVAYRDVEETLATVSAGKYGLGASVWGTDPDRLADTAHKLDAGTVWINTHGQTPPHQPFGGHRWSGLGVENGRAGLEEFSEIKVVHHAKTAPAVPAREGV